MEKEDLIAEEIDKCIASPRYFYNKYWKIYDKNGNEIPKKELTEEEWNERKILFDFKVKKYFRKTYNRFQLNDTGGKR